SDWCAVSGATDYVSSVAPGDSAVIEISLDALGTMNGTDELLMTVTTTDSYVASPYVNSDFLIRPMAPDIKLAGLKWSWADVGCGDTTLCVNAMISNVGSASADSVVLVLRDVLGSLTPVDTMGVEVDLESGA